MAIFSKSEIIKAALLFVAFLAFSPVAFAGSAHLTWTANTESDLEGYKVYYDTVSHSGTCPTGYANSVDVGNVTSYWLDTLTPGQTYYFQLTAHDTSQNESGCSTNPGEVSKLVTYRSDLNNDHSVGIADFTLLHSNFLNTTCGNVADINHDCSVGIADYTIMRTEFLSSF